MSQWQLVITDTKKNKNINSAFKLERTTHLQGSHSDDPKYAYTDIIKIKLF